MSHAPRTPTVTVRLAQAADAAVVAAIGRETYAEHFAHIWSPSGLQAHLAREFEPTAIAEELAGNQVSYFLAESTAGAIGFAKLRYPRPVPIEPALLGAELQKIYLRSTALRRGTGVQLLTACITRATALGYALMWLDVLERNTQATRFYERHGFTLVGQESFRTDRAAETLLVMTRALP